MGNVIVIDAPCGAGKTSWAISDMESNPEQAYIYVTPFLDEIERIIHSCKNHQFRQPQNFNESKIENFNSLLAEQADIAVTHSTFLNATPETISLIQQGSYILIIDEALDTVTEFNKLHLVENDITQRINKDNVRMLIDGHFISIGDNGLVKWIGAHYADSKFSAVENLAKLKRLYWVNDCLMVCVFPPEIFEAFTEVYILTYIFKAYPIFPYFQIFGIKYNQLTVTKCGDDYCLADYNSSFDLQFRQLCKNNISICDKRELNNYGRGTLTKSWYTKADDAKIAALKNHITYYFRRIAKARASDLVGPQDKQQTPIMWSAFESAESKVQGAGYTVGRRLTNADKAALSPAEYDDLEQRLKCFVPCNARASNSYRPRWALAYLLNLYYNTMVSSFFRNSKATFDDDLFAVANLLQWLCRSRIRDGEPITLYLPSKRMRDLYNRWLQGDFA